LRRQGTDILPRTIPPSRFLDKPLVGTPAWLCLASLRHSRQFVLQFMLPACFHLPAPLGSTVVTRFIATTGTLTPAPLPLAPGQVSLISERAFPDIPSPTTPCAPVFRRCSLLRAGLASDSLWVAIGGSSDFAHYSQSRQSHKAVSSLYRGPFRLVCSTDYPFVSSCSPRPLARTQLLSTRGGKHRHRGTSTLLCTLLLKRTSAVVSTASVGVPPTESLL